MRIQIDATTLLLKSAGVKNYLYYWMQSLSQAAAAHGDEINTFPPGLSANGPIDHTRSIVSPFGTVWRLFLMHLNNTPGRPLLSPFYSGTDVFHCSQHTFNPPWSKKVTATLFDMSCWTTPQYHTPQNVAGTRLYGERILKRCDGVIAISHHARDTAVDILGIPSARIRVIYPGIDDQYFRATAQDAAPVRAHYQIRERYALFVGCIEPRKNVGALLRAWRGLPEGLRRETELIIAGPFGWESEALRAELMRGEPGIRYIGYVAEKQLPGLIAGAAALIYPSAYEGFGLPVAQAMAAGVPVVTSNRSCLPEVVDGGGLLVDPDNIADLTAAIHDVITQSTLAAELSRRGRERARAFRFSSGAAQSLEFFHDVGRS